MKYETMTDMLGSLMQAWAGKWESANQELADCVIEAAYNVRIMVTVRRKTPTVRASLPLDCTGSKMGPRVSFGTEA